jgi:DNA polymerase-3 subunit epsilon
MGYFGSDLAFNEPSAVKDCVTRYRSNRYLMQVINTFAKKYPRKVTYATAVIQSVDIAE